MVWFVLILSTMALYAAPAQQKTASKWPIETLTVEGNHNYTAQQILAVAGLKVGQVAGKDEFEAARDRLQATGAFETIGYRFAPAPGSKGYAAAFQVTEVEPVYPVRFEDLNVPNKELDAWLKSRDALFGSKVPGTAAILTRYSREIEAYLAAHNQKEKIIGKLNPTGPEQFEIVFRPDRPIPTVAQVLFQGNSVIPGGALLEAISGVAVGTAFTEAHFREQLDSAVRPLYDARGRIRVSFPKITTEPAKDVNGLIVHVSVEEGNSYDLGEVRLENHSMLRTADLLKTGAFKSGDLANFDEIGKGIQRMKKSLRHNGYMRASLSTERHINDQKKTVDLAIRIEEGPQFLSGKLDVEGLDLNGEAAIRKLWSLKEGKPFDADYPDYFLARVREDGYFDNLGKTRSVVKVNEEERTVDVTLYFR